MLSLAENNKTHSNHNSQHAVRARYGDGAMHPCPNVQIKVQICNLCWADRMSNFSLLYKPSGVVDFGGDAVQPHGAGLQKRGAGAAFPKRGQRGFAVIAHQ